MINERTQNRPPNSRLTSECARRHQNLVYIISWHQSPKLELNFVLFRIAWMAHSYSQTWRSLAIILGADRQICLNKWQIYLAFKTYAWHTECSKSRFTEKPDIKNTYFLSIVLQKWSSRLHWLDTWASSFPHSCTHTETRFNSHYIS
jgi:hypothetical protein